MFSKKANNLPSTTSSSMHAVPSIVADDLKIVGDLSCGGCIEIEGQVEGNVTCEIITIRHGGSITGDVRADRVHIDGQVHGLVEASYITLSESARITGMIVYESLSIKDGAFIDGQCKSVDKTHRGQVEKLDIRQDTIAPEISHENAEITEKAVANAS